MQICVRGIASIVRKVFTGLTSSSAMAEGPRDALVTID